VKAQAAFNEGGRKDLTAEDIRYTTKGKTLYAFVMGWPEVQAVLRSVTEEVQSVELLGYRGTIRWQQTPAGLRVFRPAVQPSQHAVAFKIRLLG
jgi:alpha-L-fucosidase